MSVECLDIGNILVYQCEKMSKSCWYKFDVFTNGHLLLMSAVHMRHRGTVGYLFCFLLELLLQKLNANSCCYLWLESGDDVLATDLPCNRHV